MLQKHTTHTAHKVDLVAENEDKLYATVSSELKRKWFRTGLLELLPVLVGFILKKVLTDVFFKYDYFTTGIIVSLVVIVYFKNKTPNPPIQLQNQASTLNY
jgi:bacteriorhodopsin